MTNIIEVICVNCGAPGEPDFNVLPPRFNCEYCNTVNILSAERMGGKDTPLKVEERSDSHTQILAIERRYADKYFAGLPKINADEWENFIYAKSSMDIVKSKLPDGYNSDVVGLERCVRQILNYRSPREYADQMNIFYKNSALNNHEDILAYLNNTDFKAIADGKHSQLGIMNKELYKLAGRLLEPGGFTSDEIREANQLGDHIYINFGMVNIIIREMSINHKLSLEEQGIKVSSNVTDILTS